MRISVNISINDEDLAVIDNFCESHNIKRSNFIVKSCMQVIEADEVMSKLPQLTSIIDQGLKLISEREKQSKIE